MQFHNNTIRNMKKFRLAFVGVNDSGKDMVIQMYKWSKSKPEIYCFIEKDRLVSQNNIFKSKMIRIISSNALVSINDINKHSNQLVLIGCLGGTTGNKYFPIISRELFKKGIDFKCIVATPFHFEGRNRIKDANNAIAEIKSIHPVQHLSLEEIKRRHGKLQLSKAFDKIMRIIFELAMKQ